MSRDQNSGGPSAFSVYASRFLSGKGADKGKAIEGSRIFHPSSPTSSSHDPFLPSPSASRSHPHLAGSSRSPSPPSARTPPFPGPGIDALPDIDDMSIGTGHASGIGMGLLFGADSPPPSRPDAGQPSIMAQAPFRPSAPSRTVSGRSPRRHAQRIKSSVPNPYAPSSSESDEEIEPDLDQVAAVRRSLLRPGQPPAAASASVSAAGARKGATPLSERAKKGWIAHQSVFPPSSSEEEDGDETETESDKQTESETGDEQSRMMGQSRRKLRHAARIGYGGKRPADIREVEGGDIDDDPEGYILSASEMYQASSDPTYRTALESQVTDLQEPLLGPDELERRRNTGAGETLPGRLQVYHGRFGHWEREGLRKYKDIGYMALWLTSLFAVVFGLLFVWGSTDPPSESPSHRSAPSLAALIPLLLVLLVPTLVIPPAFLLLLQKTVRPVLVTTAALIPFSLFICGWWALGASFETTGWDGVDQGERWWGTSGLRILALLLWSLAGFFGWMVWKRRRRLERTVAVVELSTHLLLTHPPLLLLTPLLLAVFAVLSIPFLTLIVRLAMIGYWRHPRENTYIFQIRPYAGWLIFLVTLVWVWSWGVVRGVGRVAVAGVVGEWFFHRTDPSQPPALEITQAALHRATGPSLGSICLGSLIVATVRMVGRSANELRRVTSPSRSKVLPPYVAWIARLAPVFALVAGVLDQLNGYALVYVGVTGEAFWPSARRAVGLAGRRKGGHLLDYTLIKLLLTLSSTTVGMFTATAGYLYMTHALSNPAYAPVAAMLCGGVCFLAIRAGAAVLGDAADALFICYQIDRELGGAHSEDAKAAFEGEKPSGHNAA